MSNKKEGMGKKVVGGIALGLVLILLGGVAGGLLQHHYNWGEDAPTVEEPGDSTGDEDSTGGTVISPTEGSGMKMSVRKLLTSEYEEYGVSALAETAYTLTATITPENASNKAVDWSVEFVDAGAEWATGKTVTDYVTVTPTSDGALTATVENLKDFGAQIRVKATSRDNTSISAGCTVDYAKKIKSAYLVDGSGAPVGQNGADWVTGLHDNFTETYIPQYMSYTVNYTYSDYTVDDTFTMTASAQLNAEFLSGLSSYVNSHTSEQTQFAVAILGALSGEKKNPINTGNSWYYTASASGFLSLFYANYSQPAVTAKKQALNMLADYVKSLSGGETDAVEYEVTFTGTHSSYTLNFTQVLSGAAMTYAVTGIELNESNIIF